MGLKMNKAFFWKISFLTILTINLCLVFLYFNQKYNRLTSDYNKLIVSYKEVVQVNINIFEKMLEYPELVRLYPEYDKYTSEQLNEALRRKIINMKNEINNLNNK